MACDNNRPDSSRDLALEKNKIADNFLLNIVCSVSLCLDIQGRFFLLKLVLFDMGGTLVSYPTPDQVVGRFSSYARSIGYNENLVLGMVDELRIARQKSFLTLKEADMASALNRALCGMGFKEGDIPESQKEILLKNLFWEFFGSKANLINGAKDLLESLTLRGLRMGMISNVAFPGKFHEEDLRRLDILKYFSKIWWSSQEGVRKPHRDLFLNALIYFGVSPQEVVYVGDTYSRDVVGPNSVKIDSILITDSNPKEKPISGFVAKDLFEVKGILLKKLGGCCVLD